MAALRVDLYSMVNGYGFCVPLDTGSSTRVYFRVEDFVRLGPGEPLPITGEQVEIPELIPGEGKSLRASAVLRTSTPPRLQGTVKSFDAVKGWGFVECGPEVYFLHRSDLVVVFTPVIGSEVTFYGGTKKGRPRACYVSRVL